MGYRARYGKFRASQGELGTVLIRLRDVLSVTLRLGKFATRRILTPGRIPAVDSLRLNFGWTYRLPCPAGRCTDPARAFLAWPRVS